MSYIPAYERREQEYQDEKLAEARAVAGPEAVGKWG